MEDLGYIDNASNHCVRGRWLDERGSASAYKKGAACLSDAHNMGKEEIRTELKKEVLQEGVREKRKAPRASLCISRLAVCRFVRHI